MKRNAAYLLFLGIGLAACAPLNTYYKPGVTVTTLNRDRTSCEVKALADVPASVQIRREPPVFVPPQKKCKAGGECRIIRPGYFLPGEVISFDPNDGLRDRVENQCMADRGYAPVSIPPCPDSVARGTPAAQTTTLPPLQPESCVIRNKNGTFQIVTPR